MLRLLATLLLVCLGMPELSVAAVAFGSAVNVTPGTGVNTGASPSITTPLTNPVVVVAVAIRDSVGGDTIDSLTITGFGGTAAKIIEGFIAGGNDLTSAIFCIKAPTPNTAGTVQANFSTSIDEYNMVVATFSGADQTDPCPVANAVSSVSETTPETMTPSSLAADDATFGSSSTRAGGVDVSAITTAIYTNATAALDLAAGYVVGTGGTSHAATGGSGFFSKTAVRIVASSAAAAETFGFRMRRVQ